MRKATKTIVSLAVVLIAGLNFIVSAYAQDPFSSVAIGGLGGASGAGLFGSMAGMSGIDIAYTSDPVNDAMWNSLNPDSVYFNGEKHEATGIDEDIWDYITVDIGDWLQAQSDFIGNLVNTHNIDDNESGNIPTYKRYLDYPFNNASGTTLYGPVCGSVLPGAVNQFGNAKMVINNSGDVALIYNNGTLWQTVSFDPSLGDIVLSTSNSNLNTSIYWSQWDGTTLHGINSAYVSTNGLSGNIPYTSSTVNTSVFHNWGSAKVKIPHTISQLTSGWTIPDFMEELDRIWSGAGEDNIIIEDGDNPGPIPPVPIPDTPLGDVPFDDWVDLWGQGIWQQLENQNQGIDFIGSNGEDQLEELENIDSNLGDLNDTAENIDTNLGIGIGLLGGIKSGVESAVDFIEGIAEHVEELVEEVVQATETLIAGILNQIPSIFGVIFGPIKQASSIWHYVVEWIQSIGAPFQFIWSMASGTSYYIILPVYASLAAAVVLAFYKRFGK